MVRRTLFGADSRIPGAASKSDSIPTIITSPSSGVDKSVPTANGVSRTDRSPSPTEPGARNYLKSPSTVLASPPGPAHGNPVHGKTVLVNPVLVNPGLVNPGLVNPGRGNPAEVAWDSRSCPPGMVCPRRFHGGAILGFLPTHPTAG